MTGAPIPANSAHQKPIDAPRCMVEFVQKTQVDLKGYRTLTTAKGALGLITLGEDVFVCVATGSREVATVRPNETVQQIFAVEFYCLNRSDYDHVGGYGAGYRDGYREPNPYSHTLFEDSEGANENFDSMAEHPFMALKKLLSGGSFYYSYNFDLTRRLQDRIDTQSTVDISSLDEGLLWNSYMTNPLLSFRSRLTNEERDVFDKSSFLTSVIRGYVGTMTVPQSANPLKSGKSNYPATLTVISRLSARRAGTRFNSRGIDDNGNVANFVETETVFWSPTGICFSYVQVRGSIPIFWESASTLIPGQQKIQITRSPEATQLSFDRHFEKLTRRYGSVHVVNLLSETKPGEVELTQRYNLHLAKSPLLLDENGERLRNPRNSPLQKTEFDFHEVSRVAGGYEGAKRIQPLITDSAEKYVYFLTQEVAEETEVTEKGNTFRKKVQRPLMVLQQNGVFRTNCLDCLDRTNLIQGIISQIALELFLEHRGEVASASNLSIFWMRHSSLWADNGDALSKIYAGTGALKSSFTRHGKMSLGGLMADARKSATRLYVNHFEDKGRQNTTDLLLGRLVGQEEVELFDPVTDWVQDRLRQRSDEFESSQAMRFWVGTYNLNGKMLNDVSELSKWLDVRKGGGFEVVVVGFQEIVELSPQQIMNTDPARRVRWEQAVKETINKTHSEKGDDQYVLLRSGQLVGAALLIFVKVSELARIRNVEGAIKKTGMSGIAGNKGAVAIRMDIEGSSVCFVTAHLAAGFGNYDERNRDYQTIISGLRFQRDRKIEDHELVIWLGDFNYRIGTKPEYARELIETYRSVGGVGIKAQNALHDLYKNDQLNIQMVAGQTFPFYQEGAIEFLPTYKFDLGNDHYDTSEKARIPAWTDRILYKIDTTKGTDMRQTAYKSAMDLRFSDHRPVYSTFNVKIRVIDEKRKAALLKELYTRRNRQLRENLDVEEEDSDDYDDVNESIAPGLPPASTDKKKWWIDGEKPIASTVGPPKDGMKLNPNRNGNPWREGGEEEWVMVDKTRTTKPEAPPPRRGATKGDTASNRTTDANLNAGAKTPPKPPPSRKLNLGTATPPLSSDMAGAWPASRNVSLAGGIVSRPSPPPPAPRGRAISDSRSTSILDSDDLPDDLPRPMLSRTASQTSTASSVATTRRKSVLAPQRPAKPSALSAQPTRNSTVTSTDIERMRSLSPRPEPEPQPDIHVAPPSRAQLTYNSPQSGITNHPTPPLKPKRLSSVRSANNPQASDDPNKNQERDIPPPLPKRTGTSNSISSNATTSSGPPLPPRRGTGQTISSRDLLANEESEQKSQNDNWKPLLPNR